MMVFAFFALALSVLVAYYAYRMLSNRLAPPTEGNGADSVAAEKLTWATESQSNNCVWRIGQ
jgi:hypothetical protein